MSTARLILLIIGLCFVLGLAILLVSSLYQFYIQIAFNAPLLANLALFFLLLLIGALVAALVYLVYQFTEGQRRDRSKRQRRRRLKAPEEKSAAARANLKAIDQQIDRIQDRVARDALRDRQGEITRHLSRQDLRVVVFGTGSAGKTSLINALMGRMVGETSAPMGTTQIGQVYSLELEGLDRQLLITDTPGILEAGVEGTEREQMARELATTADLLLFVVDNDLRSSEYDPLAVLAEIGKRSLLAFNKTDLYPDEDRELILQKLRDRVRPFIAPTDVVAVAANPQPWQTDTGDWVNPEPDILPLIRQLAAVLRAEGEDLVADNILLQSQRLGEEARRTIDRQRRRQAEKVIERFQWVGAGAIAVTPLPVVDMLATAAVNAQMVVEIGKIYDCELNLDRGRELAFSLGRTLVSLGVVKGAMQLISTALQASIATYLLGKAVQGVTAAYLTRIAGKSFIEYFRQDQDWGDGGMTEVVQRQFRLERRDEFVKAFVSEAISKVVQPLAEGINPPVDDEDDEDEADEAEYEYEYEDTQPLVADDWQDAPRMRKDEW